MSQSDAFALGNSGLNPFLFAEVGTELNGSPLTILSVLARLGLDPWIEAARWARLPRPAIIDILAGSIAQMPLSAQSLRDARATATRLIVLLPGQSASAPAAKPNPAQSFTARTGKSGMLTPPFSQAMVRRWLPFAVCIVLLAIGIAASLRPLATSTVTPISSPARPAAPVK